MHVLILTQYFVPEDVGAAVFLRDLACDLAASGHRVTVVTGLPSYPAGRVLRSYRGKGSRRERLDGVDVTRAWLYATPRKDVISRLLNYGTFTVSSLIRCLAAERPDVILTISTPVTMGLVGWIVRGVRGVPFAYNLQDIFSETVKAAGLAPGWFLRLAAGLERFVLRKADLVLPISDGFRGFVERAGVPPERIRTIPNWADPDAVVPGDKGNGYRRDWGLAEQFIVLYSGTIGYTSALDPLIESAHRLRDDPRIQFVVAGEGVRKSGLMARAQELSLANVRFLPFQPRSRFPDLLAASDLCVVTLSEAAGASSVPSKALNILCSARPVLAAVPEGSDVHRLVVEAGCGVCIRPGDPSAMTEAIRAMSEESAESRARMGAKGREYVCRNLSRKRIVPLYERALTEMARR